MRDFLLEFSQDPRLGDVNPLHVPLQLPSHVCRRLIADPNAHKRFPSLRFDTWFDSLHGLFEQMGIDVFVPVSSVVVEAFGQLPLVQLLPGMLQLAATPEADEAAARHHTKVGAKRAPLAVVAEPSDDPQDIKQHVLGDFGGISILKSASTAMGVDQRSIGAVERLPRGVVSRIAKPHQQTRSRRGRLQTHHHFGSLSRERSLIEWERLSREALFPTHTPLLTASLSVSVRPAADLDTFSIRKVPLELGFFFELAQERGSERL